MLQIFLMVHSHFHGVNLRHRPYFSFRPFRGRLGPPGRGDRWSVPPVLM